LAILSSTIASSISFSPFLGPAVGDADADADFRGQSAADKKTAPFPALF